MMCSVMLAIWVLLAASVANASPDSYAEDKKNFKNQHLSDFTNQRETFYVTKRDYKTNTRQSCLSATLVKDLGNDNYQYRLRAKFGSVWYSFNTNVHGLKTGQHEFPNAANYTEDRTEGPKVHRIMTHNPEKSCFLITVPTEDKENRHGCFILVREDKVDKEISEECEKVYQQQCGKKSITLYDKKECSRGAPFETRH